MPRSRMVRVLWAALGMTLLLVLVNALAAQPRAGFALERSFTNPPAVNTQVVYRLVPLLKTPDEVRSRALQVGLPAASVRAMTVTGALHRAKDARWTFTVDTDRQLETLLDNQVLTGRYGRSFLVPESDQCRQVALGYLGQRRLVAGTADEGLAFERTNELLRSYRGVADGGAGAAPVVVMREVVFAKTIKGVPCTGPGTHLSVFVGDRGRVLGHVSNWMPATPTNEQVEVAPAGEGFDLLSRDLTARDNRIPHQRARATQASVRQCRYVLVTALDRSGQVIALPGYDFGGQLTDRQQRTFAFRQPVMALRDRRALAQRLPAGASVDGENEPRALALPRLRPRPRG